MEYSVYESINKKEKLPINAFVASMDISSVHWHGEYELIGVLKGKLDARIGTDEYILSTGDVILINPNEMHSLKKYGEEECLCMVLQIDDSLIENDDGEIFFYLNSTEDEEIECGYDYIYGLLANIIYESIKDNAHNSMRIKALVYTFLADLFEYVIYDRHFRDRETIDEKKLVVSAIDYINLNLNQDNILEATCSNFGVSRKTLDRYFSTVIGQSSKGILADLRIDRAKQLLKNTDKNMSFIKDSCGYGSDKTFYRVFKEATGMTPMDFREVGVVANNTGSFNGYLDYDHIRAKELLFDIVQRYNSGYIHELQRRLERI